MPLLPCHGQLEDTVLPLQISPLVKALEPSQRLPASWTLQPNLDALALLLFRPKSQAAVVVGPELKKKKWRRTMSRRAHIFACAILISIVECCGNTRFSLSTCEYLKVWLSQSNCIFDHVRSHSSPSGAFTRQVHEEHTCQIRSKSCPTEVNQMCMRLRGGMLIYKDIGKFRDINWHCISHHQHQCACSIWGRNDDRLIPFHGCRRCCA